jgi:hypothetical protein
VPVVVGCCPGAGFASLTCTTIDEEKPASSAEESMRPPRHRFSDEVRSTTRFIASRMVRGGTIARTPEALEGWIAGAPGVRESLVQGGYGTAFTAEDLFPLLEAMVVKAGGPPPAPAAPPRTSSWMSWVVGFVLLLAAIGLLAAILR